MPDDDLDFGATIKGMVPGQRVFDRYTLNKILGRGGMGVVWLARDEKLGRDIALKFLPELVALDERAVDDLKRETRRALDLTHQHIVRIYDFVDDDRSAAIAMEWVDGPSLAKRALDQPDRAFSVGEISAWVEQLCQAMAYAHDVAEVVHRDLKPANLMLDRRDHLKIADFGISATLSDSTTRVSKQAGSSGTPLYMSPQQMMGEKPAATDDIYALGATLYELLTGKPPFYSGRVEMQVMQKTAPSIADRRTELGVKSDAVAGVGDPGIPAGWEETIAACLAKEPGDRPQTAGAVWTRLSGARADEGISKADLRSEEDNSNPSVSFGRHGTSVDQKTTDPNSVRSYRKWTIAGAGVVVAVAVMMWLAPSSSDRSPPQSSAAEIAAESMAWDAKMADGDFDTISVSYEDQSVWADLGSRLRSGRTFERSDWDLGRPVVAVVSPAVAERTKNAIVIIKDIGEVPIIGVTEKLDADIWLSEVTDHVGEFSEFVIPDLGIRMMPIPSGQYSRRKVNKNGEIEAALITITRGFWISESKISRSQYEAIMSVDAEAVENNLSPEKNRVKFVNEITWGEAVAFCETLTTRGHQDGSLPSDHFYHLASQVQWEHAMSGGASVVIDSDSSPLASVNQDYLGRSSEGSSNAWGISNVPDGYREWVWDGGHTTHRLEDSDDPLTPLAGDYAKGQQSVIRAEPGQLEIRLLEWSDLSDHTSPRVGFRVALYEPEEKVRRITAVEQSWGAQQIDLEVTRINQTLKARREKFTLYADPSDKADYVLSEESQEIVRNQFLDFSDASDLGSVFESVATQAETYDVVRSYLPHTLQKTYSEQIANNRKVLYEKLQQQELRKITFSVAFNNLVRAFSVVGELSEAARSTLPDRLLAFKREWQAMPSEETANLAALIVSKDSLSSRIGLSGQEPEVGSFGSLLEAPMEKLLIIMNGDRTRHYPFELIPGTLLVLNEQGEVVMESTL